MSSPTPPREVGVPFRMTTGAWMVWIATVAIGLSMSRGDLALVMPLLLLPLFPLAVLGIVAVIPWLAHLAERSRNPEVRRPWSRRERSAERLVAVVCLGLMTAGALTLGLLFYQVLNAE